MIHINLLPYRQYQSRQGFQRVLTVAAITMALSLAALTGYHLALTRKIDQLAAANARTRQQVQALQETNRQVTVNEAKTKLLARKMAVISGLEQDRAQTVALLNEVSARLIAERMWLTGLDGAPGQLEISGIAMDEKTVADFLSLLEQSSLFATVGLKSLKQQTFNADTHLKAFAIACRWIQPGPEGTPNPESGG